MPTMPEETTEVVEEAAAPPPVEDYSDLADDEPHPASDLEVEAAAEPETGEGDEPAKEEAAAPTVESLQVELAASKLEADKYQRSQQAHYEENKRLKRRNVLEDRMDALEADVADIDEAEPDDVEAPPDPVVDPVGAAAHDARRAMEAAERVEKQNDERTVAEKRAAVVSEIRGYSHEQHDIFVAAHPDYDQAAEVVKAATLTNFRAVGIPEGEYGGRLQALLDNFTLRAFKERNEENARSASQMMYDAAKEYGYVPPNGDDPAKVEEETAKPAAPTKIQKAAARDKATTTLAASPGSSGTQQNTQSIKEIMKVAELEDEDGSKAQAAQDFWIANVKAQLPPGATDDDAMEAFATGFITQVK